MPIYDLKFVKKTHDLLVATHGRGVFVFDNLTPLEEGLGQGLPQDLRLYSSQPGVRWRMWPGEKHGFSARDEFSAPNPPNGVVISYSLAKALVPAGGHDAAAQPSEAGGGQPRQQSAGNRPAQAAEAQRAEEAGPEKEEQPAEPAGLGRDRRGPVKIVVADSGGQVVRTLYGPGKQGLNRVTWNMRYDDAKRLNSAQRPDEENDFFNPGGPAALPGKYKVAVTAAGKTETAEVTVEADPRMPFDMEAGRAQVRAALKLRAWMNAMNESINRIDSLKAQVATVQRLLGPRCGK